MRGLRGKIKTDAGSTGVGMALLFAVTMFVMLFICELYQAYAVKEAVDAEFTRAMNTAVDLSISDLHRQDHILEMDTAAAYDYFFDYLYTDMGLSPGLSARARSGREIYSVHISELDITRSPPSIRINAELTLEPAFLGGLAPFPIRFPIRGSSANRRIEE